MNDIYAFGDIHGDLYKLKTLIERLYIKEKEDILIFLGDYIDRGKYSFEVIDYLIELKDKYNCIFIKGNHELMFLDFLKGNEYDEKIFMYNGGKTTIESYSKNGYNIDYKTKYYMRSVPYRHSNFYDKLLNYHETEDYIFVHAGIYPGIPIEKNPDEILFWDRSFIRSNKKYEGKTVVCGHTPSKNVLNKKNKICIDTGSCYESMGNLTCVKLPERVFISQGCTLNDIDENTHSILEPKSIK